MDKSALHIIFLVLALALALFWVNNPLTAAYSLQLTAGLIILLVLTRHVFKSEDFIVAESLISTLGITLVTSSTGGLSSPFFFLNHFLLFELSLLLSPRITVVLTLSLITFYLFSHQAGPSLAALIPLASFAFMTPLAYLTGIFYRKLKNSPSALAGNAF